MDNVSCLLGDNYLLYNHTNFLLKPESDILYQLFETHLIYNNEMKTPYKQVIYGETGTKYNLSGRIVDAKSYDETDKISIEIKKLVNNINIKLNRHFNYVLITRYENGDHYSDPYSDNEKDLINNYIIANLSLGADRNILFQSKIDKSKNAKLKLEHGNLFVINNKTNCHWVRSIPKDKLVKSRPTINLVFRETKTKYVIYKNDLKYRKYRDLDINRIIWGSEETKKLFNTNLDTLEYRVSECISEQYATLDLQCIELKIMPPLPNKIMANVKSLFLGENYLTELPDLSQFKQLKILEIGHNNITLISGLKLPQSLVELSCHNNAIKKIIETTHLINLERINCKLNNLSDINFINKLKIKILNCSNNQINIIKNLHSVEQLFCSNNNLKDITNCRKLNYLDCKNNPLGSIIECPNIEHLVCSQTNLSAIPNCPLLQSIECFRTNIRHIDFFKNLYEILCNKDQILQIDEQYKIISAEVYKDKLVHLIFNTELDQINKNK